MTHRDQIDILMPTYQGEAFIAAQIDSILQQSVSQFRLIIRDDGSTDNTVAIISEKAKQDPRITFVQADHNQGVIANISALMSLSRANYVMLADQDDIWLPQKAEQTLAGMKQLEAHFGELPLLVHTDLTVVDAQLKNIHPSFWSYAKLNVWKMHSLNRLLVQNVVTGCTMMMNRRLLELSAPIPKSALMHDWWIALVAASTGKIGYIPSPTILYRQHASNQLGARKESYIALLKALWAHPQRHIERVSQLLNRQQEQALDLNKRCSHLLSPQQCELLGAFQKLHYGSFWSKARVIIKHRFFKSNTLRNLRMFLPSYQFLRWLQRLKDLRKS